MGELTNNSENKRRRKRPVSGEDVASRRHRATEGGELARRRATEGSELARRRAAAAKARRARELKKKKQRRKIIAIMVVILALLVAAGVGAAYALGLFTNPLDTGAEQLKAGDYKGAITSFEKAVKDKDKAAEGYRGIGMANWELKEYKACKDAYTKALKAGAKETGTIYNFMALCDMQAEDYDSALSNIAAALNLDNNSDELIQELKYNQIVAYEKKLDWENAKAKMTEYVAAYPDDEVAAREAQFLETR